MLHAPAMDGQPVGLGRERRGAAGADGALLMARGIAGGPRGEWVRPATAGKPGEKEEKKKMLVGRSGGAEPPPANFVRPRLGAKKGAS